MYSVVGFKNLGHSVYVHFNLYISIFEQINQIYREDIT